MAKVLDLIYRVKDDASRPIKRIKGEQDNFNKSLKNAAVTTAAVTAALYAAEKAYNAIIAPLIQYNKEILDASQSTGMATEDLSRFVQVADDMGIEMASVTKALEMATKNGFAPSIDSIARLADQANGMASETERAAMLAKIFGKNWAELNPILSQGGAAIREMAGAIDDALVVTREEILKTEELRRATDELNDSFTGVKNTIALEVIPLMADFFQRLDEGQGFYRNFGIVVQDESPVVADVLRSVAGAAGEVDGALEDLTAQVALTQAAEALLAGNMELYDSLMRQYEAARQLEAKLLGIRNLLEAGFPDIAFDISMGIAGFGGGGGAGAGGGGGGGGGATFYPWSTQEDRDYVAQHPEDYGALGGSLSSGTTYLVGERGPELFTPGASGMLMPNIDQLALEIRRMVTTLPIMLRDAVAKA